MNMREKVMAAMEDGGWWTVPMLCKLLGTHQKSRIYAILDSEIRWGTVERGELVRTENNGLTRLWRRVIQ